MKFKAAVLVAFAVLMGGPWLEAASGEVRDREVRVREERIREMRIREIRRHYTTINTNLRNYRHIGRDLMGYSSEGGALQGYFAADGPRKVLVQLYTGQSQVHEMYYFWNNRLIFANVVTQHYQTLETADDFTREEKRFYFVAGKLVQWADADGKLVVEKARVQRQQRVALTQANAWLGMAKAALRKCARRRRQGLS
jgi:hypothetical protein